MEPGEGPLDDLSGPAQAGGVGGAFAGDPRCAAAGLEKPTVLVVAAVGEQPIWPIARPVSNPADAGHWVQQGSQLSDIVTISADERDN